MPADLFDRRLRAIRRDRAARIGSDMALFNRMFDECLDRLDDIHRKFERALLIGSPFPDWPDRLSKIAGIVDAYDPGAEFAVRAGGRQIEEDRHDFGEARYDLCVAIGTLDSVNDLPLTLKLIYRALKPDAPLIGAMAGGNSLPALRTALIEAGRIRGRITARAHPRIDAATLAQLLTSAGFSMPVVDVDRVKLRYSDLKRLISDLRSHAATSVLAQRSPPIARNELQLIRHGFEQQAKDGRTEEVLEILHFLGWTE